MRQGKTLTHEFVEFIPDVLEEGTLYVSMEYATVVHKCCCGCGKDVVTPLSPTDWMLSFNGKTISPRPLDRELGLRMSVSLLDKEQQGPMGRSVVSGRDCGRKSP